MERVKRFTQDIQIHAQRINTPWVYNHIYIMALCDQGYLFGIGSFSGFGLAFVSVIFLRLRTHRNTGVMAGHGA